MSNEQMNQSQEKKEEAKDCSLDQVFERLESILGQMEEETSLEESFQMYRRGMELIQACSSKIEGIEKQVLILDEEGETHEF